MERNQSQHPADDKGSIEPIPQQQGDIRYRTLWQDGELSLDLPANTQSSDDSQVGMLSEDEEIRNSLISSFFSKPEAEKKKRSDAVSLTQKLEELYATDDERKGMLLQLFHEVDELNDLNEKLKSARKSYRGCKLGLDSVYYLPAAMTMMLDVATKSTEVGTLFKGALIVGVSAVAFRFVNFMENNDPEKSPVADYQFRKKNVRTLRELLEAKQTRITIGMELLGIHLTEEAQKRPPFMKLVSQIHDFSEKKRIEEHFKEEARRRQQREYIFDEPKMNGEN